LLLTGAEEKPLERLAELTDLAREVASKFPGCTAIVEPVDGLSSCRLRVFQDSTQVALFELGRLEMLLPKKLKAQIIRERLRNVFRWI
jgi:hypothetical protein